MSSRVKVHHPPGRDYVPVPNTFARSTLHPGVTKLLLFLASHAETYMIHNITAAKILGVGRNTFANWVMLAEATPHLIKCETGRHDSHGNAESVLHVSLRGFTEAEREEINSERALKPCTGVHETSALKKTKLLENQILSPPAEPVTHIPLPSHWEPNYTHRMSARKLGLELDDLQRVVDEFHEWATEQDVRRRDIATWDRTFGAFLNHQADGDDLDHYFPGAELVV